MRRRPPPERYCRECGEAMRAWHPSPLCNRCVGVIMRDPGRESVTALRRRMKGSGY